MERCGTDLETETDEEQTEGNQRERFQTVLGKGDGKVRKLQGARPEVKKRQTVQTDARSDRTHDEILHSSLGTLSTFLDEGHQNIGRKRSQFQTDEQHEQILSQSHDGHAKTCGDEENVEVDLAAVVVQAVRASVGSTGRWKSVHRGSAGERQGAKENEFKHSAELVDLQHGGATGRDDFRSRHAVDKRHTTEEESDGKEHGRQQTRQARIALEVSPFAAEEPRQAYLRERYSERCIAHVGHDHQREETDDQHKFRSEGGDEVAALRKGFNRGNVTAHFTGHLLSKSVSGRHRRSPRSSRASCRALSTASRRKGW